MRIFILFLLISYNILGQSADLQFVEMNNDGTNYDVKIQIEGSIAFKLGSANLKFNFNGTDIGSPVLLQAFNFSGGASYNAMTVDEVVPNMIVSINIDFKGSEGDGIQVNTSWTDVATVRFTVVNQGGNSQLSFRYMNPPETSNPTIIFKDDETNQVTQGSFSPLNTHPLPVELSSFSALVNLNNVSLSWKTATEVNNNGFEVQREIGRSEVRSQVVGEGWVCTGAWE